MKNYAGLVIVISALIGILTVVGMVMGVFIENL